MFNIEVDISKHPELQQLNEKANEARQKSFDEVSAFFMKHIPYDGTATNDKYRLDYSIKEDLQHLIELSYINSDEETYYTVSFMCNEISGKTFIVGGVTKNQRLSFGSEDVDMPTDFIHFVQQTAVNFQKMKDDKELIAAVEATRRNLESFVIKTEYNTERFINP